MMWTMDSSPRQPHAVLDLPSRRWKGEKIERLLDLASRPDPIRMLEVGTGSGGIAHYFGTRPGGRYKVTAVDVADQRQVHDGFEFRLVHDTALPFPDASFDVVLTNHVIEHVGERDAQLAHLREVRRVMAADAIGYLAVPNRWMLVEPHYRLAFLSWLPRSWRDGYLRLLNKGDHYDCLPLTRAEARELLDRSGFAWQDVAIRALLETVAIEQGFSLQARLVSRMPTRILRALLPVFPTLCFRLRHASSQPDSHGSSHA